VKNYKEALVGFSDKVVVHETKIEKRGLLGKAKLGIKSIFSGRDPEKTSIYIQYHDIAKRKFM